MKPLLVVRILTYNHEDYIRDCLESVVTQQTKFSFKVIIGEDCSTDNTAIICKEFQANYPDLIELNCNSINNIHLNSSKNWEQCINTGASYIALLEGDDYWTDPLKLQKQVDFLEDNIDFNIHFHNVNFIKKNVNGNWIVCNEFNNFIESSREIQFEELVKKNIISTPSVMYRSSSLVIDESIFRYLSFGDYYLHLISAHKSKVYCDKEIMANYRIHDNGVWSGAATIDKINANWKFRKIMDQFFNFQYNEYFFHPLYITEHFEAAIQLNNGYFKRIKLYFQYLSFKKRTKKSWGYYFLILRRISRIGLSK